MSGYACSNCGKETAILQEGGGERLARDMGTSFLGRIPMDPRIAEASDEGVPFVYKYPDIPASRVIMEIAKGIAG